MALTLEHIATVVESIVADYDVKAVYLFGSFARGEQTPDSDVDLRLSCGPEMNYGALMELSARLEQALGCAVELVTNPPERMRPAFRARIERDEVMLYEAA